MRLEYGRRRAALVETLTGQDTGHARVIRPATDAARFAPVPFRLLGDTAGMHVVLQLPDGYPADRLVDAAAARGVGIYTTDRYFAGPPALSGLILGYGTATVPQVRRAATELAMLLTRA
jgi:GntR family transcriptional regulator / MocR family aminotransferase